MGKDGDGDEEYGKMGAHVVRRCAEKFRWHRRFPTVSLGRSGTAEISWRIGLGGTLGPLWGVGRQVIKVLE
jgi:hypothetical protein